MELVTGRKGVAHITSQQDRMKHQGTWGDGAYILKTGQMLKPQVQSSNEIRIRDGALMIQGALSTVKVNSYDPVTIQNGTQGMKRIDLICWQYTYDAEQDVESAEWVVIQGTPAESDPQQPAYTDGDIQQGDSPVQVPVFAVELDGINVTGVTTLLPTAPTLEKLNDKRVKLWEGSASGGDTINLAESAYEYNWLVFLNNTDGIKATLPITPNMSVVRCSGTSVTENGNFGSFGVHGSLTSNGSTVELNSVGYITHTAGSDHTRVSARTVSEVYGFR